MQADGTRRDRSPLQVVCFCALAIAAIFAVHRTLAADGIVQALDSLQIASSASTGPSFSCATVRWTDPSPVISGTLDCRYPMLAVDQATGQMHLTWEEDGSYVRYAYRDGQGWQVAPHAWSGHSPAIALDIEGLPHIVYASELGSPPRSQIQHRSARQGWVPSEVSSTTGNSQCPEISLLIGDEVHVTWVETLDGVDRIYHAISRDVGETWLEMSFVALGAAPALDAAGDGEVWLAWQGAPESQPTSLRGDDASDIYLARWLADSPSSLNASGGTWAPAANVSSSYDCDSRAPAVISGPDERAHVVWEEVGGNAQFSAIQYAREEGDAWTVPITLSGGNGFSSAPFLVGDPGNTIHVAWDAGLRLEYRAWWEGQWSAIQQLAANATGIADICLAIVPDGMLDAVWSVHQDGGAEGERWTLFWSQQVSADTTTPTKASTVPTIPTPSRTPFPSVTATPSLTPTQTTGNATTAAPTDTPTALPTLPTDTPVATPTLTATMLPTVPTDTPPLTPAMTPWAFLPVMIKDPGSGANPIPVSMERRPADKSLPSGPLSAGIQTGNTRKLQSEAAETGGWEWLAPANISSPSGPGGAYDAGGAGLATMPDGSSFAVWSAMMSGYPVLHYSIWSDGSWSAPQGFYMGEEPDLTATADGELHLVYTSYMGGVYDVYHTQWVSATWDLPDNVSQTSGNSTQPAIVASDTGLLVTIWTDNTEGFTRIYYGWRQAGLWNTFFVPASAEGHSPDIALGDDARIWVSWQVLEPSGYYDVYALYGSGDEWSPFAINVSTSSNVDSLAPRLAGVPGWGSFITWQEGDSSAEVYFCDTLEEGFWWAVPSNLSQTAQHSAQPAIAAQGIGQTCTVYVAWDEGQELEFQRRQFRNGSWSPHVLATGVPGNDIGQVELATGLDLGVQAAWLQAQAAPPAAVHDVYHRLGRPLLNQHLWTSLVMTP